MTTSTPPSFSPAPGAQPITIAGMGWVTPLGADLDTVWRRLMSGDQPEPKPVANPESGRVHHYIPVPPKLVDALGRTPRLRRSSAISYYAIAAGLSAMENAGLVLTPETAARTAVIFAISSGGVLYTRKFYEQIVKQGANAASPLLFPETVYNAPASHLAAQLGIDGASYTLVGDSSIGLSALKFAEQLLATDAADTCVVVGTEEIDWVLCEAYADWRFAATSGGTCLYAERPRGAVLAEGAAALVLTRGEGRVRLPAIHDGAAFASRVEAAEAVRKVCADLAAGREFDCVVGSANGSFADRLEKVALEKFAPAAPVYCPKAALGEALGASALLQVIIGALALQRGELPAVRAAGENAPAGLVREPVAGFTGRSALVLATGLNQQAGGAVVEVG